MSAKPKSPRTFTHAQVAAFRMAAHHLCDSPGVNAESISAAISGVQAQVMTYAELQFWARNHSLTRAEIASGLYKDRSLVKSHFMRQTLHVIPSNDFSLFNSAMRSSLLRQVHRIAGKLGVTTDEFDALNSQIVESLRDGPLTQSELRNRVLPRSSKRMKAWMSRVWSILRTPIAEGLICYGPARGAEITYVRTTQWLPRNPKRMDPVEARKSLLLRYLAVYGPATPRDFSKWSGIGMPEVQEAWGSIEENLAEVTVEGEQMWLPRKSLKQLHNANLSEPVVRLLPAFDPFLLAHAAKDHLVHRTHYKRVYRNQGWISPVVLIDGRVASIWAHARKAGKLSVEVKPFEKFPKKIRALIEEEAESLARFLDSSLALKIS
ncbi:MAG: winged helix DNA-binding domain-containing protein [Candidatus Acidiferrales bacterium]